MVHRWIFEVATLVVVLLSIACPYHSIRAATGLLWSHAARPVVVWYKNDRYAMLFCAMQCYAMLCYAMLCYAMLCYAMPCYAMPCYAEHLGVQLLYRELRALQPRAVHQPRRVVRGHLLLEANERLAA